MAENPGRDIYLISGGSHVPYVYYNGVDRNQMEQGPVFERRMRELASQAVAAAEERLAMFREGGR